MSASPRRSTPPSRPRNLLVTLALAALWLPAAAWSASGPAAVPTPAQRQESRAQLVRALDDLFSQPPLNRARVSAEVVSLEDGAVVYGRNAEVQLNPASNTKLITAAAALLRLGPEFRFTTEFLAQPGSLRGGKVRLLAVRGRGDPSVTLERLDGMVRDLVHRGLREVGELVLDDTWFDGGYWGPGWETEDSDKAFAAPSGALSVERNVVGIYVIPGEKRGQKARIELQPEAKGFFTVEEQVLTMAANVRKHVAPRLVEEGEGTRVIVSGRVPAGGETILLYRRVTEPTLYFGHVLKQLLAERGVKVDKLRRGPAPDRARVVAAYESPELSEIVRDMNKVSSNFIAEMLLRAIGAEVQGAPGTWPKGVDVASEALAELGLARGTYQLENGSGLNDTNRFSARHFTTLLAALWRRFPVAAEFVASLPIAARDGTLRHRLDGTAAAGRLRAKTGTLDKVTALSGYLQSASGERLAFSILANDWSGRAALAVHGLDRFASLVAASGQPLQGPAAPRELTAAERVARAQAYAQLAAARDKLQLPFLRSAARGEADPLLRLLASDALFRTDADAGASALLEALAGPPELFVQLKALSAEVKVPLAAAVLSSLLDLSADGVSDALARLLQFAQSQLPPVEAPPEERQLVDPDLRRPLADGLVDVSEAAPEELWAALRRAPVAQAHAAVLLLEEGFALQPQPARSALLGLLGQEAVGAGSEAELAKDLSSVLARHAVPGALLVRPAVPRPGGQTGRGQREQEQGAPQKALQNPRQKPPEPGSGGPKERPAPVGPEEPLTGEESPE